MAETAEMAVELVTLTAAHERLLEAYYRGIYWDAFEAQREPLEVWLAGLRGELPYRQTIRLALAGERILGGVSFEQYPRSRCGLVTYSVVAPEARRAGLGRRLLDGAVAELRAAGAPAVFGEVVDPRPLGPPDEPAAAVAWARLRRNQRWGARVLGPPSRYVQPSLGPGLPRDRGLVLLALTTAEAPLPPELDGVLPRSLVEDLYAITEGGSPDPEVSFPPRVPLIEL